MTGPGPTVEIRRVVTEQDTALAVGSGVVPVLGTPVLVAWAEQATLAVEELAEGYASVGTLVELKHRAPSRVGAEVVIRAELLASDGPGEFESTRRTFVVSAWNADNPEKLIGQGLVRRSIVEIETFLNPPPPEPLEPIEHVEGEVLDTGEPNPLREEPTQS